MNTYQQLDQFLGRHEHKNVANIRSTMVIRRREGIAVQYHNTDVVTAYPDGTFKLQSGGFRTATTKARINDFSPARIYQKDFQWFLAGNHAPFFDGILVNQDGLPWAATGVKVGTLQPATVSPF